MTTLRRGALLVCIALLTHSDGPLDQDTSPQSGLRFHLSHHSCRVLEKEKYVIGFILYRYDLVVSFIGSPPILTKGSLVSL